MLVEDAWSAAWMAASGCREDALAQRPGPESTGPPPQRLRTPPPAREAQFLHSSLTISGLRPLCPQGIFKNKKLTVCSVADGRREAHDPVIGCRYLDTYASTALAPHQSKHQLDEAVLRLAGHYGRDASSSRAQHFCAAKAPSLALRAARLMIQ